ncbi:hypothetical protein M413DRAFT_440255 [Hebeloma cylindrosporum]|uniref:Uncharacterized protein n=1 Tax=Hebeloma cylindrosporum TaxID=76867 RepID=A0A0C2YA16_HEBCY|nr:hypothetical protein M413DRAFT_440255 [Hebeloma cylindrosporum h7]
MTVKPGFRGINSGMGRMVKIDLAWVTRRDLERPSFSDFVIGSYSIWSMNIDTYPWTEESRVKDIIDKRRCGNLKHSPLQRYRRIDPMKEAWLREAEFL